MTAAVADWGAIENALRQWVVDATELQDESCIWARPTAPQRPRPFATIEVMAGPIEVSQPDQVKQSNIMRDRITVSAAQSGLAYRIRIFDAMVLDPVGQAFEHVATPGQDPTAIRDSWAAALAASPYDVSTEGASDIVVDGTEDLPHFHSVVESGLATRETEIDALTEVTVAVLRFTLRVVVELDRGPGQPATDLLSRCAVALRQSSVRRTLRAAGLVRRTTFPPVNVSRLIGMEQVDRAYQEFQFHTLGLASENKPWVRTAVDTGTVVGAA